MVEVLGDRGQLPPGTTQVPLDLTGDGARQGLVTCLDVCENLRQQYP